MQNNRIVHFLESKSFRLYQLSSITNIFFFIQNIEQKDSQEHSFYMTVAEIVAIIFFAIFNVYYIKRVLDNKRTIWMFLTRFNYQIQF